MRKCLRCGSEMREGCGVKTENLGDRLVAFTSEKPSFRSRIDKVKVAVCPQCGEISFYVENTEKLKRM